MSNPRDENGPADHVHPRRAEVARGPSEAAPQEAPAGGPPSQSDTHLVHPSEADRPALPGDSRRPEADSPGRQDESGVLATEHVVPNGSSDHPGPPPAAAPPSSL